MKRNLNILFAASEVFPFSKTGGLADIAGSLPKEIAKQENITVITPLYSSVNLANYHTMNLGKRKIKMGELSTQVNYIGYSSDNVNYVFVDHHFYQRDALYGYMDDNERFMLFNFSILEYIELSKTKFDIIHINDWQAGLVPYLLNTTYRLNPIYTNIKTILSIHNLQYQGAFSIDTYKLLNLPFDYNYIHFNNFNFLKSAILSVDYIATVSETYKNEIQTEYFGQTLDGSLKDRCNDLYGILNGIDDEVYNPETDIHIPFKYNEKRFVSGKKENKQLLLKQLGLDQLVNIPLVCYIGRMVSQKGIDLMMATLEEAITATNANFVFLGSGEENYENFFRDLALKYPNRVYTYIGFSNSLAHKLYAASDLLMMPSQFEPCGLSQMIAMRYGTLPVVRETGGLKDTVIPYNKYTNEGNGFSFANYNAHEFKDTLIMAVNLYINNQYVFRILQTHAMNRDFSLTDMGNKYLNLYKNIMNK